MNTKKRFERINVQIKLLDLKAIMSDMTNILVGNSSRLDIIAAICLQIFQLAQKCVQFHDQGLQSLLQDSLTLKIKGNKKLPQMQSIFMDSGSWCVVFALLYLHPHFLPCILLSPSQMPSYGVKAQHQAVNLHKTINFTYVKFKSFSHFEDSFIVILGSQSHFLKGENFIYTFTTPPSLEAYLNHVKAHFWIETVLYRQRPLAPC